MKALIIALLGASLLASGAALAKQPTRLAANANQYYDLYQGTPRDLAPSKWGEFEGQTPHSPANNTFDPLHHQLFTVGR